MYQYSCGEDFLMRLIERSILHLFKSKVKVRLQHNKQVATKNFYMKTQIEKNYGEEREKIYYILRDYSEFSSVL